MTSKENENKQEQTEGSSSPVGVAVAFLVVLGLIIAAGVLGR